MVKATPPRKVLYQLWRKLSGSLGRSGRVRKISPLPGFDPRTIQPVAQSLYWLSYPGSWHNWVDSLNKSGPDFNLYLTYGRFTSLLIQKRHTTALTNLQLPDKIMCLQSLFWRTYWHVRFKWGSLLRSRSFETWRRVCSEQPAASKCRICGHPVGT
jgi:hypothetical protein